MFILNLRGPADGLEGPRLDSLVLPIANQEVRENNNNNRHEQRDSVGVLRRILSWVLPSADLFLPPVFRDGLRFVNDSNISDKKKCLARDLFYGNEEARLAYISGMYSQGVADELRNMQDLRERQQLEAVLIIGAVDPNPTGPLGQLLSILPGLTFSPAIAAALCKVTTLKALAEYLLQVAARRGDSGPTLEYNSNINRASGSVPPLALNTKSGGLISTLVGDASGVVEDALATVDRVHREVRHRLTVEAQIAELRVRISDSTNPTERNALRRQLDDLIAGNPNQIATA